MIAHSNEANQVSVQSRHIPERKIMRFYMKMVEQIHSPLNVHGTGEEFKHDPTNNDLWHHYLTCGAWKHLWMEMFGYEPPDEVADRLKKFHREITAA